MPLGGAGEEAEVEPVARGEADRGRGEADRGRGGVERPPSVRIFHRLEKATSLKAATREKNKKVWKPAHLCSTVHPSLPDR